MELTHKIKYQADLLLELAKVRITFFVAISSSVGYILANGNFSWAMILPVTGVFLLACGSSAMNHYQERRTDALMDRTRMRPIPSGRISPQRALIYLSLMLVAGLGLLYWGANLISAILGMLAVFWYNLFYTPLKKITPLAVVPGALIGAIPPVIGWTSAGGYVFDPKIIAIALFFFIWQIPHFWLLLLMYADDYERGGFPTLTQVFSRDQITRVTFTWIVALAVSCLIIPLYGLSGSLVMNLLLFAAGLWLVIKSVRIMLKNPGRISYRFTFREINTYVLIVVLLLTLNRIFNL